MPVRVSRRPSPNVSDTSESAVSASSKSVTSPLGNWTVSEGRTWTGELHNKAKDGREFWEQCSIAPISDRKGLITHYVAVKEDITESKAAREALIESEERLKEPMTASHGLLFLQSC